MAVTLSYSNITIRGITYKQGSSFKCYASNGGNGISDGTGSTAMALTVGTTYYVYAKASGTGVTYPYAVSTSSGGDPIGWYKENVFPYATYSVKYNANGGSGAPAAQTKTYGTNLTLSSTKPTRTGYTFQGWGTSASDTTVDYAAGATYSANAAITLYAIWKANTYTVSYNANGGSGAPSSQTKTYGVTLKLSTTKPTRTNYEFLGWSTNSKATAATYAAGGSYTANAAATLYAVWKLKYLPPIIENFKVTRCNSSGTVDDFGTYAKVTFDWECSQLISSNPATSIVVYHAPANSTSFTSTNVSFASGAKQGSVSVTVGGGNLSIESQYQFKATVVDTLKSDGSGTTTTSVTILPSAKFVIDFLSGGKGVALGKVASVENTFEVDFNTKLNSTLDVVGATKFTGGITPVDIPSNANLNNYTKPGFYKCQLSATAATVTNSPTKVAFSLEVTENNGAKQVLTTYETSGFKTYVRQEYNSSWGAWERSPYEGDVRTLSFKKSITSGANLNAMGTPGTYACNDTIAASLLNCPTDYGFTMTIEYSYADEGFLTQHIYVPYYEIEYRRRYNTSNSTWSTWKSDFGHDTGWITLSSTIQYRRVGRTVYVIGSSSGVTALTSNSYTTVGTLPEGFRPSVLTPFAFDFVGGYMANPTAYIEATGAIKLYQKDSGGNSYWRFHTSFPTDTSA